jgi:UDP-sugar pyrophosphorylase
VTAAQVAAAAPSAAPAPAAAVAAAPAATPAVVDSLLDTELDSAGARILEELVASCDQAHLTEGWVVGEHEDGKRRLHAQLAALEKTMPGGVCDYVRRAQRLLETSREGKNPFDGYVPSVPSGVTLAFGSEEFEHFERLGAAAARRSAFVIVAGGLGERLGYSGIKLALPSETMTGTCYLELYVRHILALQALTLAAADGTSAPADAPPPTPSLIPVIIMTSDDTDAPTRALLDARDRFGLAPSQLHLIKQGKVPCLADGRARLATEPNDRFCLLTKPHGHGDVHALLHTSGLARKLLGQGCNHLVFLQDTNALVFGGVPAALGVSVAHSLAMNTLSVPRRAGDASGALMALTTALSTPSTAPSASDDAADKGAVVSVASRTLVVNVEYNQLDALVRASLDARGDYNDPATGYSPFPGNTNQLIFSLGPYVEALEASGGAMPEFVNPKYTDGTRTKFKSPTRLECMMQVSATRRHLGSFESPLSAAECH